MRIRLTFKLREPFSAGSHLFGALAGIFGGIYLLGYTDGSLISVLVVSLYSVALVSAMLTSALFHGLHCSDKTLNRLERMDYAAIYFFIAATYTPLCIFVLQNNLGIGLLIGIWLLAFFGMWLSLRPKTPNRTWQALMCIMMGWGFLLALPSISSALAPLPFYLLLLGGACYTIGAIIFLLDWPHLSRKYFSAHDCWHLLVLGGIAAHYAFFVQIIA